MGCVIQVVDSVITAPAVPPMTVAYAKRHIKAITNVEDVLIASWIQAAGQHFSEQTGRDIITTTREIWLDGFPGLTSWSMPNRIELPHPPLQEVVSVRYVDSDGTLQSFDDGASPVTVSYAVRAPQGPYAVRGWVEPAYGFTWPTPRAESGSVRIQFKSGYGDNVEDVPEMITAILCWLVGHFDQYRSAVLDASRGITPIALPMGVDQMITAFKFSALSSQQLRSGLTSWV